MSDQVENPEDRFSQNEAHFTRGTTEDGFSGQFFSHSRNYVFFRFVVAIFDLVHNVETIFHLTASGNLF